MTHTRIRFGGDFKDLFFITFGILCYAVGFTAFVLPEEAVMGGVTGISALLYYAFGIPAGASIWVINALLLLVAYRHLSRQFTVRTIMGVTMMSVVVSLLQPIFAAYPLMTPGEDKFMHLLLGGAISGAGLGMAFSHNGSTGGTDIVIALLNKYTRMSFGRALQFVDISIICSSYLIFHSVETIVYGVVFTLVASYACDYIINGSRQTVQFIIISKKYDEIADAIINDVDRGATLVRGTGWYSKKDVSMLIVLTRRHESQEVFNLIKSIDPAALVSQTFCHGVFGEGFDKIK